MRLDAGVWKGKDGRAWTASRRVSPVCCLSLAPRRQPMQPSLVAFAPSPLPAHSPTDLAYSSDHALSPARLSFFSVLSCTLKLQRRTASSHSCFSGQLRPPFVKRQSTSLPSYGSPFHQDPAILIKVAVQAIKNSQGQSPQDVGKHTCNLRQKTTAIIPRLEATYLVPLARLAPGVGRGARAHLCCTFSQVRIAVRRWSAEKGIDMLYRSKEGKARRLPGVRVG